MLRDIKKGTATGDNHIQRDIESRRSYHLEDTELYTKCLPEGQIPTVWQKTKMVIIFKKYIPLCLLSNIYKVLTKLLTKRLEKTLDENQPREQVGFRSRYSMTDHIHVIIQLKEKCREYNVPLCITFVDYDKSFLTFKQYWPRFKNRGQKICSSNSYTKKAIRQHQERSTQGDTILPTLFTATVESIFLRLTWKNQRIDGEYLSHLCFDDIFICA